MRKSNLARLAYLSAWLLLSWGSVWGQDSANTTSSGSLEEAQSELLSSIDSLLSLETEWTNLQNKMASLQEQISVLRDSLQKGNLHSEQLEKKIKDSETALQSASARSIELGKLLEQQRQSLGILRQNYGGLLRLSKKLQESLQESKDWNVILGAVAGSLAVGWTLYAIIRR